MLSHLTQMKLKNESKMRRRTSPCVMRYHKVSNVKDSEQYRLILPQLYMPWVNKDTTEGKCAIYEVNSMKLRWK